MHKILLDLVITESCNLKCNYCYMTNRQTYMSKSILPYIFNFDLFRDKKIDVTFFGGEPLLNFKFIQDFIRFKQNNNINTIQQITLITNGILLDTDKLKFFKENNIGISLSFDGNTNDNTNLINVDKIKKLNIKSFKYMIHPKNIKQFSNDCINLLECGLIPDISIVRDNIWYDDDIITFKSECAKLTNYLIQLNKNRKNKIYPGFYNLWKLDIEYSLKFGKRNFACSVGHRRYAIFPTGDIYPCARFGSDRIFKLGNVYENEINQNNIKYIFRNVISNPKYYEECKHCELYSICNGQCIYSSLLNGNFQKIKPIKEICELYKICFENSYMLFREVYKCQ